LRQELTYEVPFKFLALFYARAFTNSPVYRPSYVCGEGGTMPLEANIEGRIQRVVNELVESGISAPMETFVSAVAASLMEIAAQVDSLRSELIAKGIDTTS
jgi:hypothetical protein